MDNINGLIIEGSVYLLEKCHDDCVCDTCSLQKECSGVQANNLCDMVFDNVDGSYHFVTKGHVFEGISVNVGADRVDCKRLP